MAKVRVQARGVHESDETDSVEKGKRVAKKVPKYSGSIDVLRKVLKEDGFIGWYRVRTMMIVL